MMTCRKRRMSKVVTRFIYPKEDNLNMFFVSHSPGVVLSSQFMSQPTSVQQLPTSVTVLHWILRIPPGLVHSTCNFACRQQHGLS